MMHLKTKYDISQFGQFLCLNKRLDISSRTCWSELG
jgi:hypothetical protein